MLIALLVVQFVVLLAVCALASSQAGTRADSDPRLAQLPEQLSRLIADEARRTREDSAASAAALRNEVVGSIATLGQGLKDDLRSFREDNTASADKLRSDVEQKMRAISQGFSDFKNETGLRHSALEESLNRKLIELMGSNAAHQEKLRVSMEERLAEARQRRTQRSSKRCASRWMRNCMRPCTLG